MQSFLFQFPPTFLLISSIAAILAGALCSIMGVFVVRMNLSSIGFTMSHAAFAGAAFGLMLSLDPLMCAVGFSTAVAFVLGPVSEKAHLRPDVILGVIFSMMIALGFIFLNLIPGSAMSSTALSILWGSIFGVSVVDLLLLAFLTFVICIIVVIFFKEFEAIMFDRKLAEAAGIPTRRFYFATLFLTGLVVALTLKIIGGLLVFALIVNSASTVYQFSYNIRRIMLASPLIGGAVCLAGLFLSLIIDFPVGSSIVIVSSLLFAMAIILSPKRRRG